jgi:hypothetical protein
MLRAAMVFAVVLSPAYADAQTRHHHHTEEIAKQTDVVPMQPGQGAFAAIQEIVEILEADPETDWSKVDIGALRQHLIDMDNVALHAQVEKARRSTAA